MQTEGDLVGTLALPEHGEGGPLPESQAGVTPRDYAACDALVVSGLGEDIIGAAHGLQSLDAYIGPASRVCPLPPSTHDRCVSS